MAPGIWKREDVQAAVKKVTKQMKDGDIYIVLKFSNRNHTVDHAWEIAYAYANQYAWDVMQDSRLPVITNIIWGWDIHRSGYPHINMVCKLAEPGAMSRYHLSRMRELWDKIERWSPGVGSYTSVIKSTEVRKSPYHTVQYLYKRTLQCRGEQKARGIQHQVNQIYYDIDHHLAVEGRVFEERKRGPKTEDTQINY